MDLVILILIACTVSISNGMEQNSMSEDGSISEEAISPRESTSKTIAEVETVDSDFDGKVYKSEQDLLTDHDEDTLIKLVTVKDCGTKVSVFIPRTGLDSICTKWFQQKLTQGNICPNIYLLLYKNLMNPPDGNPDGNSDDDERYGSIIPDGDNPGTIVYAGGERYVDASTKTSVNNARENEIGHYYRVKINEIIQKLSYIAKRQKKAPLYFYDLDRFNNKELHGMNNFNHNFEYDIMRVIGEYIPLDLEYPEKMITRGFKKNTAEFQNINDYDAMIFPQILCLLQVDNQWYLIPIWYSQSDGGHSSEDFNFESLLIDCITKRLHALGSSYLIEEKHKNIILPEEIVKVNPVLEQEP